MPIVPVFSGEDFLRKVILGLMEQKSDPEKKAAVKAAFGENLIDLNNGDMADVVSADLNDKIIHRFFGSDEMSTTVRRSSAKL